MSIYTIYRFTNRVNGKVYIGYTSQTPERRYQSHTTTKLKHKLHQAFDEYGLDNFAFDVIYQSKDGDHTLNVMEQYFIDEYDSIRCGYNMVSGGSAAFAGMSHSEETKRLMSEKRKGCQQSEEHKAKKAAAKSRPITLDGVTYPSFKKASEALSIATPTLRYRIAKGKYTVS